MDPLSRTTEKTQGFHPEIWGRWTHFDLSIFFRWVGEKPPNAQHRSVSKDPEIFVRLKYSDFVGYTKRISSLKVYLSTEIPQKITANFQQPHISHKSYPSNFHIPRQKYLVCVFTYIYHTKLTIHVSKYIIPHWVEMWVFVRIFLRGFSAMKNPMVKFQVHVAEWVEGEKLSQSQAFQLKMWGCDMW